MKDKLTKYSSKHILCREDLEFKKNRLIYTIDYIITKEQLEKIISVCEIDYFAIDSIGFSNVKDYFRIISYIKELCEKYKKLIGIIVKLKGRKMLVNNFRNDKQVIHLKKNQLVRISTDSKKMSDENTITVNFNEFSKLVKKDEKIILNDNKGSLTVLDIVELRRGSISHTLLASKRKFSNETNAREDSFSRIDEEEREDNLLPVPEYAHHRLPIHHEPIIMKKRSTSFEKRDVIKLDRIDKIIENYQNYGDFGKVDNIKVFNINNYKELKQDNSKSHVAPKDNSSSTNVQKCDDPENDVNYEYTFRYKNKTDEDLLDNKRLKSTIEDFKEIFFEGENNQRRLFNSNLIDNYIILSSHLMKNQFSYHRNLSNNKLIQENSFNTIWSKKSRNEFPRSDKNSQEHLGTRTSNVFLKRKSLLKMTRHFRTATLTKKYEVVCKVDYDCVIYKNSFLFVPNVDYKPLGIDLLSQREVAEIALLDEHNVDFMCISITDMNDINSIKEILSENSVVKIIASIPDYMTLKNINEILEHSSGVLISRTFQILNEHTKNSITQLTKFLISKCKEKSKPIFTHVDMYEDFLNRKKTKINELNDVMYNINDGMDGFFINIKNSNKFNFENHLLIINYFIHYFKSFEFSNNEDISQSKNIIHTLIKKFDDKLEKSIVVYIGQNIQDIETLTKIKTKSNLVVISSNTHFLNHTRLFYSVQTILEDELGYTKNIEQKIKNKFKSYKIIFYVNDEKFKKMIVKIF